MIHRGHHAISAISFPLDRSGSSEKLSKPLRITELIVGEWMSTHVPLTQESALMRLPGELSWKTWDYWPHPSPGFQSAFREQLCGCCRCLTLRRNVFLCFHFKTPNAFLLLTDATQFPSKTCQVNKWKIVPDWLEEGCVFLQPLTPSLNRPCFVRDLQQSIHCHLSSHS